MAKRASGSFGYGENQRQMPTQNSPYTVGGLPSCDSPEFVPGDVGPLLIAAETKKEAASACYRGDPRISPVSDNRRVPRPAICCISSDRRVVKKITFGC